MNSSRTKPPICNGEMQHDDTIFFPQGLRVTQQKVDIRSTKLPPQSQHFTPPENELTGKENCYSTVSITSAPSLKYRSDLSSASKKARLGEHKKVAFDETTLASMNYDEDYHEYNDQTTFRAASFLRENENDEKAFDQDGGLLLSPVTFEESKHENFIGRNIASEEIKLNMKAGEEDDGENDSDYVEVICQSEKLLVILYNSIIHIVLNYFRLYCLSQYQVKKYQAQHFIFRTAVSFIRL